MQTGNPSLQFKSPGEMQADNTARQSAAAAANKASVFRSGRAATLADRALNAPQANGLPGNFRDKAGRLEGTVRPVQGAAGFPRDAAKLSSIYGTGSVRFVTPEEKAAAAAAAAVKPVAPNGPRFPGSFNPTATNAATAIPSAIPTPKVTQPFVAPVAPAAPIAPRPTSTVAVAPPTQPAAIAPAVQPKATSSVPPFPSAPPSLAQRVGKYIGDITVRRAETVGNAQAVAAAGMARDKAAQDQRNAANKARLETMAEQNIAQGRANQEAIRQFPGRVAGAVKNFLNPASHAQASEGGASVQQRGATGWVAKKRQEFGQGFSGQ